MKNFHGLCALLVVVFGAFVASASPVGSGHLLGAKECTWGPSYWCSNLTSAKNCNAVRHCIQTVWEKAPVPEDNDSICQICKDMVKQARDQLRSNETMEELKEVLDGSCNLIPIKLVKKECCKLADNFIPELVEALSSQMNPDQVCSVAGLCNNAEIDETLRKYYTAALDGTLREEASSEEQTKPTEKVVPAAVGNVLSCGNCGQIATLISEKFTKTDRDTMLENILHLCGEMSSFSDACSNIVLTYFNDIYSHLKQSLNAQGICHISGTCAMKYHQHPEDEPTTEELSPMTTAGGDDIPCELCEQLVKHLRDVLVANTTETEFKTVLEGLCKQTKGFQKECLSIVDQYYDVIYETLVNNLDSNGACFLMGVCPKGKQEAVPYLPVFPPAEIKVTIRKKLLGANEPKFTQEDLASMALPIDHLMGAANPSLLVENGELCTLCEYMLHFMQEELATPKNEEEIKKMVNSICHKLPSSIGGQCHNFIDMYGDAVIALLIQGLNPRDICPKMQMCPKHNSHHDDIEVFAPHTVDETDTPTCPLCLFAVEQAQAKIKDNKTKKNIKNVLDHLCTHLPNKLKPECVDFIETYSNELIDMLITDFKPQEICVSLKLCPKSNSILHDLGISLEEQDNSSSEENLDLNEVDTSDEMPVEISFAYDTASSPECILCEEVIKHIEKRVNKHTTKEDIKRALQHSCEKLRKNMQQRCHKYIDRYGDRIADLILREMCPKMICRELGVCLWSEQEDLMEVDEALKYDVIALPNAEKSAMKNDRLTGLDDIIKDPPTCVLCEFVMTKLEAELKDKTEQDEIKRAIETICNRMPKTVAKSCDKFVEQYANVIISLIGTVPPKQICQRLQLCLAGLDQAVTDEVIECGVCHGASMALLPFLREHTDQSVIAQHEMVSVACGMSLPGKYYQICADMIGIYGQSIMHLAGKAHINEAHICAEIGKCFENERSSLAFARISA